MGYYTDYKLESEDINLIQELRAESEDAAYAIQENGDTGDATKWYGFDEDLIEISKKHPDNLFTLQGAGEENGDIWVCYFKHGKKQMCEAKITFAEFNEEELI